MVGMTKDDMGPSRRWTWKSHVGGRGVEVMRWRKGVVVVVVLLTAEGEGGGLVAIVGELD